MKRWRDGRRNTLSGDGETISETPYETPDETCFIGVHEPSLNGNRTLAKRDGQGQEQGQDTDINIPACASSRRTSGNSHADEDEFVRFWASYPRKLDKGHARKAWKLARHKATADAIINGVTRCQFSDDPKYRPLAATWLNGERWTDDPQSIHQATTTPGATSGSTFTRMSGGF